MNEDLREFIKSLTSHDVEFLVIGAHAVAFYGRARFTEDIDLWLNRSAENAERFRQSLEAFGLSISVDDVHRFVEKDRQMIRLGAPPYMVDILNFAGNASFDEVASRSVKGDLDGLLVDYPSLDDLRNMKSDANRPQDLADLDRLKDVEQD
jgi:predicted nucleotidyltransferase